MDGTSNDVNEFLLLTFADLKSYKYYYWFGFPALLLKSPGWMIQDPWRDASHTMSSAELKTLWHALNREPLMIACFIDMRMPEHLHRIDANLYAFLDSVPAAQQALVFVDPSQHCEAPGWPLRNILTMLHVRYGIHECRVLCWKEPMGDVPHDHARSMMACLSYQHDTSDACVDCIIPRANAPSKPDAVGWERDVRGRLVPKLVALGEMLDPQFLADQAVDLNLRLMRWRMVPDLALDTIQSAEALLIGAGTLGCYVARTLLGWGVRNITLVDNGRVSFSNPVRQPLYEFHDCLDGGRPKAVAAADALRRISPGVHAQGVELAIPMPGHAVPSSLLRQTREAVESLEALIRRHDVVFVLTDSRESRWLPTLLGAAHNKVRSWRDLPCLQDHYTHTFAVSLSFTLFPVQLVINAALGYDTYVVMRHGTSSERVGCYFCSDVVAPSDSQTDRTLDQMCTVSRPGLAAIAGATAVELMVSILQHPHTQSALSETTDDDEKDSERYADTTSDGKYKPVHDESVALPHQIRGNLGSFTSHTMESQAFEQCTACSPPILSAYEHNGADLVCAACDDPSCLEHISGVQALKADVDARAVDIAWDNEHDDDD